MMTALTVTLMQVLNQVALENAELVEKTRAALRDITEARWYGIAV